MALVLTLMANPFGIVLTRVPLAGSLPGHHPRFGNFSWIEAQSAIS
jgi:hypothetical protein